MPWTSLTFAFGSVLTSTKMTQLQDNFTALAAGSSGAPTVSSATTSGACTGNSATATSVTGSAAVTGALTTSSPTVGLGYAVGAGGSVTQSGAITNSVTLNKLCGKITTVSNNWAGGAAPGQYLSFQVLNSTVAVGDSVIINDLTGSIVRWNVTAIAAGSFYVCGFSPAGATPGTYAVNLQFAVIKSVQS